MGAHSLEKQESIGSVGWPFGNPLLQVSISKWHWVPRLAATFWHRALRVRFRNHDCLSGGIQHARILFLWRHRREWVSHSVIAGDPDCKQTAVGKAQCPMEASLFPLASHIPLESLKLN